MGSIERENMRVVGGSPRADAPVIYVIDSTEHPFPLDDVAAGIDATVVDVPVRNWNDALTPWPAAGLYRGEPDFGGAADSTLDELLDHTMRPFEAEKGLFPQRRALCGYSLGGLFSLYALVRVQAFSACGCLSGSVWYEGLIDYLRRSGCDLAGRYAYLSIGTKERRAARPQLKGVQRNMEECARILEGRGCEVRYVIGPGNHFQYREERYALGLAELARHLGR